MFSSMFSIHIQQGRAIGQKFISISTNLLLASANVLQALWIFDEQQIGVLGTRIQTKGDPKIVTYEFADSRHEKV